MTCTITTAKAVVLWGAKEVRNVTDAITRHAHIDSDASIESHRWTMIMSISNNNESLSSTTARQVQQQVQHFKIHDLRLELLPSIQRLSITIDTSMVQHQLTLLKNVCEKASIHSEAFSCYTELCQSAYASCCGAKKGKTKGSYCHHASVLAFFFFFCRTKQHTLDFVCARH